MDKVLHSQESDDHGTPVEVVEFGRDVLGHFDLDPASSGYWNTNTVKARRYYDERINGLTQPWYGRMIINPPGTPKGERTSVPRAFWDRAIDGYRTGRIECVWWIGFQLGQLQVLQSSPMHPLQFLTIIPSSRLEYLLRGERNGPPVPGTQPPHASYITFIPPRARSLAKQMIERFVEGARRLDRVPGAVVRPI